MIITTTIMATTTIMITIMPMITTTITARRSARNET
jgi:hypothetical protein